MIHRLLPALGVAGLLAGCIDLAPRYRQSALPTPAAFPTGAPYPAPTVATPVVGWRDYFIDPRLQAVIAQALANNRDLRVAVANIAAARAQYVVQRSNLFPKLDAQLGATYGQFPAGVSGVGGSGGTGGGTTGAGRSGVYNERLYRAEGVVSAYQLDLFGKIRDMTRASFDQYLSTRAGRDAAQITLVAQVATDYLTVGSDTALLAIARDTQKSTKATFDLTQARFTGGVASQLDVAQADTLVQQARFDIARLTTLIAQDRNALDLLVGAPVSPDLLPSDVEAPGVEVARVPSGLPASVLLTRLDVVRAEDQLRGANANIGAARAAFFPDISLTASGGVTSLALSTLFRSAAETWSFAPTITQPIFDAGANRGNLAYAKAQRDVDLATYEKAIQTAFREASDALADLGTIDERLAAQRALTDASALSLRLSNARYERGADTYLNALIAQRTLYASRQTLVTAQLARAVSFVTLYTALGGGAQ